MIHEFKPRPIAKKYPRQPIAVEEIRYQDTYPAQVLNKTNLLIREEVQGVIIILYLLVILCSLLLWIFVLNALMGDPYREDLWLAVPQHQKAHYLIHFFVIPLDLFLFIWLIEKPGNFLKIDEKGILTHYSGKEKFLRWKEIKSIHVLLYKEKYKLSKNVYYTLVFQLRNGDSHHFSQAWYGLDIPKVLAQMNYLRSLSI